jgi:ABC-type glycerol-3-phosphate transport system substrate-binding protein
MYKILLLTWVLGLLITLLFSIVNVSADAVKQPYAGVTLNVVNMLGWPVTDFLREALINGEFEKETGIKVILSQYPFTDLKQKQLMEQVSHSGAYDVLLVWDTVYSLFAPYTVPLDEYISNEGWKEDMDESHLGTATFNGNIQLLPFHGNAQYGIYRESLFTDPKEKVEFQSKYGYELRSPQSIKELLDISEFFTRDTDGDGKIDQWGLLFPGKFDQGCFYFEGEVFGAGIPYLDENWRCMWGPSHPETRAQVIEIAKWDQDLVHTYRVTPSDIVAMGGDELLNLYLAGKAAMVFGWLNDFWFQLQWPEVVNKIGETGSFVIPTRKPGYVSSCLSSWGWAISKDSKYKDAAWEFIKWSSSPEMTKRRLTPSLEIRGTSVPTWKSVLNWAAEKGYIPVASLESQKRNFVMIPRIPEMEEVREPIYLHHEELLSGKISPEEFVDITAKEIEDVMRAAGYLKE